MSKKKNNGKSSSRALLYKILTAVIVLAVALGGYYLRDGDKTETTFPYTEPTEEEIVTDTTDVTDEPLSEVVSSDQSETELTTEDEEETSPDIVVSTETSYDYYLTFYNDRLLDQHYKKHGIEMGFDSPEEYEEAANKVIFNEETLHKTEKEDGDDVYYLEDTNEFVIVSTDGYIRTYFLPDDGIRYFNRQ